MMDKSEIAEQMFLKGYNCAQSVLYAFAPELDISWDTALKISCGLGAGMARKGEICGAVTGAILVIGLKYGRENEEKEAAELTYAKTNALMDLFSAKRGSCNCKKLLNGCDLSHPNGQADFKEKDYYNKVCLPCVKDAVDILVQIS